MSNKHKELWRHTPMSVSRLSPGHVPFVPSSVPSVPRTFCPLNVNLRINWPKRPGCPWDVPNLSPGRSHGVPTTKFLYVIFLYRCFSGVEKLTRSSLNGVLNRALLACKNGRFTSSFSSLRYRTFIRENCLKKCQIYLSKAPLQKPF